MLAALGLPADRPARRFRWWLQACERVAVAALAWVTALAACCGSRPRCPVARGEGDPGGRPARRGALRHGQRVQRTLASTCWRRPAPPIRGPEGRWASSSPHGPERAARAIVLLAPASPVRTRRLAAGILANPPRETTASAPPFPRALRRAKRGASDVARRHPRPGGGFGVEAIAIEEYVARVLAGEAAAGSPPAALESACRGRADLAIGNRRRHHERSFDLCKLTHCQVLGRVMPRCAKAAAATRGQICDFDGAPASVFHSASAEDGPNGRPRCGRCRRPVDLPSKSDRGVRGRASLGCRDPGARISSGRSSPPYLEGRSCGTSRWMGAARRTCGARCLGRDDADAISVRTCDGRGPHLAAPAEGTDFTVRRTSAATVRRQGLCHGVGSASWVGAPRRTGRLGPGDPARVLSRPGDQAAFGMHLQHSKYL